MEIARTVREISELLIRPSRPMALVPTMGALHDGHLSLIKQARESASTVVVSIFVNPKQFDSKIDYKKYPKNYRNDIKILKRLKVNYLYKPSYKDIF